MTRSTVADLVIKRLALVERRVSLAHQLVDAQDNAALVELAKVQLAIDALDAVIAEGRDEPEGPGLDIEVI